MTSLTRPGRFHRIVPALLLTALAVTTTACGSDGYPGAIDDPAAFIAQAAQAECEYKVRCHVVESAGYCGFYVYDYQGPPAYDPRLPLAVARDTVAYSADAAGRCVDGLRARTCSVFSPSPAECEEVFEGRVAAEGAVSWDFECASGEVYAPNPYDPACDEDRCCEQHCFGSEGGTPFEPPERGESCLAPSGYYPCARGLRCNGDICVDGPGAGGACDRDRECPEEHACQGGRCTAYEDLGDRCLDSEISRGSCADVGAVCAADGTCRPRVPLDGACDDVAVCELGLECDAETHRCVAFGALGDPCDFDGRNCAAGLFCENTTRQCSTRLPNGEVCRIDFECAGGHCSRVDQTCADPVTCP